MIPGAKELALQQAAEADKKKQESAKEAKKRAEAEKKKREADEVKEKRSNSVNENVTPDQPPQPSAQHFEPDLATLFDEHPSPFPPTGNQVSPIQIQSTPNYRRPPQVQPRHTSHSERDRKRWWEPSIHLRDIRKSRYPSLTAYRNLMVIAWWIFSILLCFVIFLTPFYVGAILSEKYRSENAFLNAEIEELSNLSPSIMQALESAKSGRGLSDSERQQLREALYVYDYPQGDTLGDYREKDLTSSEVSAFAASFNSWREKELQDLAESKPSLFPVIVLVLLATIAAWAFLVVAGILYTILLLVPPECIQLAIDVESGIRAIGVGNQQAQHSITEQPF